MSKGMLGVRVVLDWTSWIRLPVAPSSHPFVLALLATLIARTVRLLAHRNMEIVLELRDRLLDRDFLDPESDTCRGL